MTKELEQKMDVIIVGGGPAGIGVGAMLKAIGVKRFVILEKNDIGSSFRNWPEEMRLITPSFTTNYFGQMDLNSVISRTSPAYTLKKEHPSGKEYAHYLKVISEYYELPVVTNAAVDQVESRQGEFQVVVNSSQILRSQFLVWAAGEFQYPSFGKIPGAKFCIHSSTVRTWKEFPGKHVPIIGGYESGIDAAINLSRLSKEVTVFDRGEPWSEKTTDPSCNLSPYTSERFQQELINQRIHLRGKTSIAKITKENNRYILYDKDGQSIFDSVAQPVIATGFHSSLTMVKELFSWHRKKKYALLNENDESRKTPGLFLAGPQVRHEDLIFCFIYKFRQRFGVVANCIGNHLGINTSILDEYRSDGLYLDDLSCCGEECNC